MRKYTAAPVLFASLMLLLFYVAQLFGLTGDETGNIAPLFFGASFCAVSVYYTSKSIKKTAAALTALVSADLAAFASVGSHLSLAALALLVVAFVIISKRLELYYTLLCCALVSLLVAALSSILYERYTEIISAFAYAIRGRGAAFGTVSNPFNLLFGSRLDELFYYGYYSTSTVQDGKLLTGAADIFKFSQTAQKSTSEFLTGRYYASIFIPLGVFVSLYKKLNGEMLLALAGSLVLSIVSGDERLFYFSVLIISPLVYVGMLLITYISYAAASFIDIRIGFDRLPSVVELIKNVDKPVYLILTASVVALLSYFMCRLVLAKFSVELDNALPHSVKPLVSALGGRENIVKLQNSSVIVKNPKLIDIIKLDCEISENAVLLTPEDIDKLQNVIK